MSVHQSEINFSTQQDNLLADKKITERKITFLSNGLTELRIILLLKQLHVGESFMR